MVNEAYGEPPPGDGDRELPGAALSADGGSTPCANVGGVGSGSAAAGGTAGGGTTYVQE